MATHSSILAWKIPWIEEPAGYSPWGSQRIRHDWARIHTWGTVRLPIESWQAHSLLRETEKTKYFVGGGGTNCKSFVGRDGGRPFPRLFPKAILSHSPATVSPHPGPGAGNHTITEPFVWDLFPKKGNTLSLIKDTHILEQWFSNILVSRFHLIFAWKREFYHWHWIPSVVSLEMTSSLHVFQKVSVTLSNND